MAAISPTSPAAAAWGDPAIIARCGFAALSPTTLDCIQVNGIDWVVEPLDDGVAFTTYGRDPALEVLVPKAYAPEPMVLPDFDQVPQLTPAPEPVRPHPAAHPGNGDSLTAARPVAPAPARSIRR